ncbi:J domain-containing protein [Natrinema salsiterrestre]|uniref:DnaJ domain-containing protein n=1 Tax=Natrinema salsiterrestre TaxID=2950540 RepID=A0A9Q4L1W1_9EURY|nr:DnaJ domain-containing protein [Natrinema salsiterrestre]MDF9746661.1 DnaJ domain-containing protein [Natrinema salsiterrestre]
MGETYYEVLEVDPDATHDEIESAYRERVLDTHPDHSDAPDAAEQFKRVTTARSVLTDGTERARYDRLGHDAYVGLAQGPSAGSGSSEDDDESGEDGADSGKSSDSADQSESNAGARTDTGRSAGDTESTGTDETTTGTDTTATGAGTSASEQNTTSGTEASTSEENTKWQEVAEWWINEGKESTRTETDHTGRTRSHHARQRSKRRQKRAKQRAAGNWPFDTDETTEGGGTKTRQEARATTTGQDDGGFEYSVHDWDGDVDLGWDGHQFDQTTAVSVGSVAVLYPLFVVGSLTPMFSFPVNAIIAGCTFVLVGYLLTMPRIAMAAFGGWSVLFSIGILQFSPIDPVSILGILALAFVWVPLGYAVALWWVLRP